jgi:quercetin dioxygenase-like cupin family protein
MPHLDELTAKEIRPGFFGKLIHGDKSTLAVWNIKKGSILEEHQHPHEQITYIVEGEMDMTIGGELFHFRAGSIYPIPSNVPHSAIAITDCKVVDSFAPARDDYK